MNNQTPSAQAGADAQPNAVANSIDNIVDAAVTEGTQETETEVATEESEAQTVEKPIELSIEEQLEKLRKVKSRDDRKIGKLTALKYQQQKELEELRARVSNTQVQPQNPTNTGEPKELDYTSYADYMRAVQKYDLKQEMSKFEGKQNQTQQTQAEQSRLTASLDEIGNAADKFIAEVPDAQEIFDECEDTLMAMPNEIKRVFLEAGPGAELAVYNLAKQGKLADLADMSPARAAMEIGRAQIQVVTKPKTKAPTPLPVSRGSVAGGKKPEDLNGDEIRSWLTAK